ELLVARRRIDSRVESLLGIRELVGRWKADWPTLEKPLSKLVQHHDHGTEIIPAVEQDNGRRPLLRRACQLLEQAGENLRRLEKDVERLLISTVEDCRELDRAADSLHQDVRHVRMLPFAEACQG